MSNYHRIIRSNILGEFGRQDVSQTKGGSWLDLSPASFGARLSGRTDFRLGELVILAENLGVPFSTLVEGIDATLTRTDTGKEKKL